MPWLGLQDNPNQQMALELSLGWIHEAGVFHKLVPNDWRALARPGSELDTLVRALPPGPVDLRQTIQEGLWIAWSSLDEVARFIRGEQVGTEATTMVLTRTALAASARIVYALTPAAQPDRLERSLAVMQQEASSLRRLYKEAARFGHIASLPPAADRSAHELLIDSVLKGSNFIGDAQLLLEVARVSSEYLDTVRTIGPPNPPSHEASDLLWIFNVYSGVAHGYAWPQLMWTVGTYPTNFVGDLMLVAMLANRAHQLAVECAGIDLLTVLPTEATANPEKAQDVRTTQAPRSQPRRTSRASRRSDQG